MRNEQILELIPSGAANAVSMKRLAAAVGTDPRTVRKIIADLREGGAVILSNESGYFRPELPEDLEEIRLFIRKQTARGKSSFRSVKSARDMLEGVNT